MRFDFGRNWAEFSRRALSADHVEQARSDFAALFHGVELTGKTFLDVGFGQGLSLLIAAAHGARVTGCDIDPLCAQALQRTALWFPDVEVDSVPLVVGSILDVEIQKRLGSAADGGFDVVHAWGVLHHTGDLWRALQAASSLVGPGGHLVVAIYNRHWTSPIWRGIKWLYGQLPRFGQRVMVSAFYPIIWTAKLVVTRQNPTRQERGMDFYHDVVDWVGGYPYEYATAEQVQAQARDLGFECLRLVSSRVPTGCNELVFRKAG